MVAAVNVQECKGCGFKVMTDESVADPTADWYCPLCAAKAGETAVPSGASFDEPSLPAELLVEESPPAPAPAAGPPRGLKGCPSCGGVIKVVEEQYGRRVRCPLCQQPLSVTEKGEVEEFDEFKEYLKERARENREGGGGRSRLEAARDRAAGSTEDDEDGRPPEGIAAAVTLYFLLLVPFLAGLFAAVSPAGLKKVERILAKVLPMLG
jgi:hypothetical protein